MGAMEDGMAQEKGREWEKVMTGRTRVVMMEEKSKEEPDRDPGHSQQDLP